MIIPAGLELLRSFLAYKPKFWLQGVRMDLGYFWSAGVQKKYGWTYQSEKWLFGKGIYKFMTFRGFEYSVLAEGMASQRKPEAENPEGKVGAEKGWETNKESRNWKGVGGQSGVGGQQGKRPESGGWRSLMEIKMCGRQKRWWGQNNPISEIWSISFCSVGCHILLKKGTHWFYSWRKLKLSFME